MNQEKALDRHTRISVAEAYLELEQHHMEGMVMSGEFYARVLRSDDKEDDFERVTVVFHDEIKSRPLMLWMGY